VFPNTSKLKKHSLFNDIVFSHSPSHRLVKAWADRLRNSLRVITFWYSVFTNQGRNRYLFFQFTQYTHVRQTLLWGFSNHQARCFCDRLEKKYYFNFQHKDSVFSCFNNISISTLKKKKIGNTNDMWLMLFF